MSRTSARLAGTAFLLAVLVALGLPGGTTGGEIWNASAPESAIAPTSRHTTFERRVLVQINTARRDHGLGAVRHLDPCVDRFSESWARHLARSGLFEHRRQTRILNACDLSWVGEALVRGTGITPADMVTAWLHSPPHRAILLKPRANHAGIGVVLDPQGRLVGVLNFSDPH